MIEQPTIDSGRLTLRPFNPSDAKRVQELAGEKEISDNTLFIPHPYPDGLAEEWIGSHKPKFEKGEEVVYAITLKDTNELIGAIGLMVNKMVNNAETGYWIGKPYWGNGYATEALEVMLGYGFGNLKLNKIHANYLTKNPASGHVMCRNGMRREGFFRKHVLKNGVYEDIFQYAILKEEFENKSHDFTVEQIDHVELFVTTRYEAAKWYREILGLKVVEKYKHWAKDPRGPLMISSDNGSTKLALFTGTAQNSSKEGGIRLIAFRVGGSDFLRFLKRCDSELELYDYNHDRVTSASLVDHNQAFSLYFNDPYGHRLEITTYEHEYVKKKLMLLWNADNAEKSDLH